MSLKISRFIAETSSLEGGDTETCICNLVQGSRLTAEVYHTSMANKRSWLFLLKKLFVSGTEPKQGKKDKRRKWILFGRAKIRGKPFPIALPSPPAERTRDVRDTSNNSELKLQGDAKQSNFLCARELQEHAAINIQTAFRGYLERKALRALKRIVKLQAIIRGQNVRRQAMHTLKCLQSIVNIHSQACAKRTEVARSDWNNIDEIIKMDMNSQKKWDRSALTKEEADALFISKKHAAFKRGRVREYAFNHRNSAETDRNKVNGRWRYRLDQWVDTQASKSKEVEDLDSVMTSNQKPRVEYKEKTMSASRRSLHRKQCSLGEDSSFTGSPAVPTYMAATESAKAKARSLSSPRLRPGNFDAYSDSYSPCKNRFNVVPSQFPGSGRHGKLSTYQQRSPSLKGIIVGPIKSSRALKDLSFDSECSFKTWHQQIAFRCQNN